MFAEQQQDSQQLCVLVGGDALARVSVRVFTSGGEKEQPWLHGQSGSSNSSSA
jgi:hypothetical protein